MASCPTGAAWAELRSTGHLHPSSSSSYCSFLLGLAHCCCCNLHCCCFCPSGYRSSSDNRWKGRPTGRLRAAQPALPGRLCWICPPGAWWEWDPRLTGRKSGSAPWWLAGWAPVLPALRVPWGCVQALVGSRQDSEALWTSTCKDRENNRKSEGRPRPISMSSTMFGHSSCSPVCWA